VADGVHDDLLRLVARSVNCECGQARRPSAIGRSTDTRSGAAGVT
jgi:hypothetical protein